jgi:hypothetical protein
MAYDLSWEDTYSQFEAGLLGKEQFADFRAHIAQIVSAPGLRSYFLNRPLPIEGPTAFHRFINALLSESAVSPSDE